MTFGEWLILCVVLAPWAVLAFLYFVALCFRNMVDRNPPRLPRAGMRPKR